VTIAVVSGLLSYDVKNEFDPLLVERMKSCLKQLVDKDFIKFLCYELLLNSTLSSTSFRNHVLNKYNQELNGVQ
jgi:hypothetical protein